MKLNIKIKDISFNNPIFTASGTFGYGREFQSLIDLNQLGAIVTKTVTLHPRTGNAPPRIVETASGMLNAIGLENDGVEHFILSAYPFLKQLNIPVIISTAANQPNELAQCIRRLDQTSFPAGFEINLSCPNIDHAQKKHCLISQDKDLIQAFVSSARSSTDKLLIAKLTPNVADISHMAQAAEQANADAVSLVNTYLGLSVDAQTMQPVLGNVTGGLSGPAIKPLALYAVWKTFQQISIPIIGMGGMMNGIDAAEFMLCGGTAVQVGTANFVSPRSIINILHEFEDYLTLKKRTAASLVGQLHQ
jgi:dihydroorotate dehydrogenase (NAD+) catalytic subunit